MKPWLQPVVTEPSTSQPLPPLDVSLDMIFDELRERAQKGEAKAACRLGFELERCRRILPAKQRVLALEERVSRTLPFGETRKQIQQDIDRWERIIKRDEPVCGTVSPQDASGGWQYFLQAANAGHVPSMVRFVTGATGLLDGRIDGRTIDAYIALRDSAPSFLEAGISAGYSDAYLAGAHLYQRGAIEGLRFPNDPVRGVALHLALEAVAPRGQIETIGSPLPPDPMAQARAIAESLKINLQKRYPGQSLDLSKGMNYWRDDASICEESSP